MGSQPIRLGIAGLGRAGWGMQVAELQGREDKFQIVAACDLFEDRLARLRDKCGSKTYSDIGSLIADEAVEMVSIATRSCDHFDHAKRVLEAGKHVLIEKPMCVNFTQAQELQKIAQTAEGKVYIRHNRRFEPTFRHIQEIIASGILGEVFEIKLRRLHYQRRDDWQTLMEFGGGMLLNWGPHIVDHALRLLDAPVCDLWSDLRCVAAVGDAEDHLHIVLRGENGRVVDLQISGGMALNEPTYLVFGTRGALSSDERDIRLKYLDPHVALRTRTSSREMSDGSYGSTDDLVWVEETIPVQPARPCSMEGIWDEIYNDLRLGIPFEVTLEQAVQVIEVITRAKEGTPFAQ